MILFVPFFLLPYRTREFAIDNRRDLRSRSRLLHDNSPGCGFPRVGVRLDDL